MYQVCILGFVSLNREAGYIRSLFGNYVSTLQYGDKSNQPQTGAAQPRRSFDAFCGKFMWPVIVFDCICVKLIIYNMQ